MITQLQVYRALLLALIVLNSGFIVLTDDKRAGIPFVRELFTVVVIASTALLFLAWKRVGQSSTTYWILFMAIVLPITSALFAKLNFGQPIPYGLLEERRFFLYLVFFPTLFLLYRAQLSEQQLAQYVLYAGLACVAVGFLYFFKIFPENAKIGFQVDDFIGIDELRPDRFRIGEIYVTICAFMLMYSLRQAITLPRLGLLLLFTAYLWFVLQTRQTMLVWALAGVWIFRTRLTTVVKLLIVLGTLIGFAYLAVPALFDAQYDRLMELFSEAAAEPGVRENTIEIILEAIRNNSFMGMGALSLQWNNGFENVYNRHFYLADVGVFGVYYRYGFLALFVLGIFYLGFLRTAKRCRMKGPLLQALQLTFVTMCLNFILSNALTFAGDVLGMAAAFFVYYAATQRADQPCSQLSRQVSYDRLQYRHN